MNASEKFKDFLNKGSVKDYTYTVIFLLVSSFFIFVVIKPVLGIAISLNKEADELERINTVYETNITKILKLQSDLESVRSKKYLLSEALPDHAHIKGLLDDIQKAASSQDIELEKIVVTGVQLKSSPGEEEVQAVEGESASQLLSLQITIAGSYSQTKGFMEALLKQRRIKSIDSFVVKNLGYLTESDNNRLQLDVLIESYYL